jgi:hypothetical protein
MYYNTLNLCEQRLTVYSYVAKRLNGENNISFNEPFRYNHN